MSGKFYGIYSRCPKLNIPSRFIVSEDYTFKVSYLLLARIEFPNLNSTQGIGISSTEINPKRLVAQPIPSFAYIWSVNRGNAAPSMYLNSPFAASALAAVKARYVSTRYIATAAIQVSLYALIFVFGWGGEVELTNEDA